MTPERWQRIEEIFAHAHEAPEAERAKRVHALAGDDRALAGEVLSLLAAAEDASGYLDGLASRLALGVVSPPDCSGRTIGPYRLTRLLGHGGMGSVYLARRADGVFDQTVALKLLPQGATQPALERRFRAERQILAGLQHPNIARLLDGGVAEDGTPYFAMEYVDGIPLDDYCRRYRPTAERKLTLFLAVCSAVEAAHRNLVIHRDLKPANVLVAKDGSVKLLDFGIATLLDDETGPVEKQPLSPAYASPEQLQGGPLTTAVDVWGLGAVLYELLAERRPFDGRDRVDGTPPPPGRLGKDLPRDLDAIVATALQRSPERRYASVALLADDVRRHLQRRPVRALGSGWRYRLGCFARRHRFGVAGAATIVLLLAALSAVSMHAAMQSRAQAARIAAERDASRQVARFLADVFSAADPATQRGDLLTARELLDRGAVRARTELAARPDVQAAMLATIGRVYRQIGLPDRALPLLEQSLAQRRRLHVVPHPEIAESLHELGLAQWRAGQPQAAQATLRHALGMRRTLQRGSDDGAVSSRIALGELLLETGKPADAERELREAVREARALGEAGAVRQARALYLLATALHHGGRLPEAADSARRAAALYRRLPTAPTPEAAESLLLLAGMERVARRPGMQVRALYAETLALHRRLYGDDHPRHAAVLNEAALAAEQTGDVATARMQLDQAIAIYRRARPPDPDGLAVALTNLGDLRRRHGDPDGAERAFDESLQLSAARPDAAAGALYLRAQVHQVRGDLAKAARDLDESAALYARALGPHNPMLLRLALARGELAHARGEHARARALLRSALEGYRSMFGPEHARTVEARRALTACLREDGRRSDGPPSAAIAAPTRPAGHGGRSGSRAQ